MKKPLSPLSVHLEDVLNALEETGISIFLYFPQEKKIIIPDKLCEPFNCETIFYGMPESFANRHVYPEDRSQFIEMYSRINRGEQSASSRFRSIDKTACVKDTLTTITRNKDGQPQIVFGVVTDATESFRNDQLALQLQKTLESEHEDEEDTEIVRLIAESIGGLYYAIYHISLETMTFTCFHQKMEGILIELGEKGSLEQAIESYIKNYVLPEDQAAMREFASISTIQERLRGRHSISHTYRRYAMGWTRGTVIAGKRDKDGNATRLIYTVADINAEIELENRQKQVAFDAEHDPLTRVYNRKGFERILLSKKFSTGQVGFLILDIDNFKTLNDNYGHDVGDKVLIAVAEQLTTAFYNEDIIARIGGDEFAILLQNCTRAAWDKICIKLRSVHTSLVDILPEYPDMSITLSSGLTFSEEGYRHEMYRLADNGLYETKKRGRAGCTLIGRNEEVLAHWKDETLSILAKNVLTSNNTGLCQIEIPSDPTLPRRLICGSVAKLIMGIPKTASPEECYIFWRDRIEDSYRDALDETERSMINYGQTECTFLWNHPDFGKIYLRCGGFGQTRPDKIILSGYCHTLKDTRLIEREDDHARAMRFEKSHASLLAALDASNQLCYEYDPIEHTSICLTDENFFRQPKLIENYPESLRDIDLIHPEDVETFIETAHRMDEGNERAHCDVRFRKDDRYVWYSCTFSGYYDLEKDRQVAILNIVDITLRMATLKNYEERISSLSAVTENTQCMSIINLTHETYEVVECKDIVRPFLKTDLPLRDYLTSAADSIIGEDAQDRFREIFDLDNLKKAAAEGNMHREIDYLLKMRSDHYEWIHSAIDMVQNPLTGEITGAVYSRSFQKEKMNQVLLEKTLEQDYLFVAVIFVDTDEFYFYNYMGIDCSEVYRDFWNVALKNVNYHGSEELKNEIQSIFVKEKILAHLEHHGKFTYAYNGFVNHVPQRLELRFSYADASHTMLLASMRNITDASLLERYRYDSEHDSLTDLYNRKTLFRKCRELLAAHPDEQFVMVHVDLKHFRLYNTFFGDAAGDRLLCDIADQFRKMDADYAYWAYGRIEADVFAALFPYNEAIYQKHLAEAAEAMRNYRSDFLLELTIGLYVVTDRSMPIEAMFTRATLASKVVDPKKTDVTVVFDEAMETKLREDQEILNEMHQAVEQEQFEVYLQPKYDLRTGKPVGAEALVRWNHPVKGMIPPGRFIPLFENNGFINVLDRYMWEHTCMLLSRWKKEGRKMMPISVNISRISLYSKDAVEFLKNLVRKYNIEPEYLELELTESAYVENQEEICPRLTELQAYGFRILMDDFGSGYSSLNALIDLPVDILKLDMKFLASVDHARGEKILSSVVGMSKLLGLPIIAEGVEKERQASYLKSIGCEYVQGYLFAKPMPVIQYEETVMTQA